MCTKQKQGWMLHGNSTEMTLQTINVNKCKLFLTHIVQDPECDAVFVMSPECISSHFLIPLLFIVSLVCVGM